MANQTKALLSTKASATAMAMDRPSRVLVPRPSSSMTTMLRLSMLRRMKAVSRISAAKVETLASMLSSMEIRAKS